MKKTPQPHTKTRNLLIFLVLLGGIAIVSCFEIQAIEPVPLTASNFTEPLIELIGTAKYPNTTYSPNSIRMNSTDIFVEGVLPRKNGYGYRRYNIHLRNYFNGEYNCLSYEQSNYGVGSNYYPLEGMFFYNNSSSRLYDVDFDIISGRSGDYGGKYCLEIISRR